MGMVAGSRDFRDLDGRLGCNDNGMESVDFGVWDLADKGDGVERGRIQVMTIDLPAMGLWH